MNILLTIPLYSEFSQAVFRHEFGAPVESFDELLMPSRTFLSTSNPQIQEYALLDTLTLCDYLK